MGLTDEQLRQQLPPNYGHQPFYRLRWRFDYLNKPTRFGGWNSAHQSNMKSMAAFVDKTGIVRASIEGEKFGAWTVKTFAEIDGHDYASCQWNLCASVPAFFADNSLIRRGSVVGLSMLSSTEKITVFVDGTVKRRPLTEYERGFQIREHTIGGE